jgi:hypothetical protein
MLLEVMDMRAYATRCCYTDETSIMMGFAQRVPELELPGNTAASEPGAGQKD